MIYCYGFLVFDLALLIRGIFAMRDVDFYLGMIKFWLILSAVLLSSFCLVRVQKLLLLMRRLCGLVNYFTELSSRLIEWRGATACIVCDSVNIDSGLRLFCVLSAVIASSCFKFLALADLWMLKGLCRWFLGELKTSVFSCSLTTKSSYCLSCFLVSTMCWEPCRLSLRN